MGTPMTGSGRGSDDSWQSGSHSGTGNNDFDAALLGSLGESLNSVGRAMSRQCVDLKGDLLVVKPLTCFFHDGQITCRTHDDTY